MAKTNILPLVAIAGAAFLLLKKDSPTWGADWGSAKKTVMGDLRRIKHSLVHGDLLLAPKTVGVTHTNDTLKISGANPDWDYKTASESHSAEHQGMMVEVHHDRDAGDLYVTSLVAGSDFDVPGAGSSIDIVGGPIGSDQVQHLASLVRAT